MNDTIEKFKTLKDDMERWIFVMENQDKGIIVHCDNDDTFITIEGVEGSFAQFHGYIGWSDGVFDLLNILGIRAESV